MARAILFDVDGTLVDSNYFHVVVWWEAFADNGHRVSMNQLHHLIGQGSDRLVESVLGHGDDAIVDGHSSGYGKWIDRVPAFDGARELLRRVKQSGLDVVLASSASSAELDTLRRAIDADDAIDHATSKDDAGASKPAPDIVESALAAGDYGASDCILVGDTVWDVEAAKRAGVTCVGVLTGGISEAELREAGAVAVYRDVAELLERFDDSPLAELARR